MSRSQLRTFRWILRLSPVSLWRLLPVVAGVAATILFACSTAQRHAGAEPDRLRHAAYLWQALALSAAVLALFPRRYWPASLRSDNQRCIADAPWTTALLLTAATAIVGMLFVGLLALYPSPLEQSAFKAWPVVDKRWIAALYLLAVALVYLPGLFRQTVGVLISGGTGTPEHSSLSGLTPANATARPHPLRHATLSILVGSLLALVYVAPLVRSTLNRKMDSHELVQLGGLQAIEQGKRPFIEARTQYGPGQQIVGYKLVEATEFTLRGVRVAHLIVNFATIAIFFAISFFAFGWSVGGAVVLVSLFISPLQVTSFVGWGQLVRWIAPVLVGAAMPLVLWSDGNQRRRYLTSAVIGAFCGLLAWMSQENGSTSVMTMLLVLSAAIITRQITIRDALLMAGIFVGTEVATLLASLAWLVGQMHLGEALTLYRGGSGLVFNGMTNTPWSDAETFLTSPIRGRGPAEHLIGWRPSHWISGWRAAYRFTPVLIIGLTALALYPIRRRSQQSTTRFVGQLLGMLAAGTTLGLLTLFRADSTHFIGMSMALAPVMVLSVAYLPTRVFSSGSARGGMRLALVTIFFLVYPFLSANTEFRFRNAANIGNTIDGVATLSRVWGGRGAHTASQSQSVFFRRLGYRPTPTDSCCRNNPLTYAELGAAMDAVHAATAGRSVYVDTKSNYSPLRTVASAVYFLGDLKVGTTFVEPMMSIWTDADVAAVQRELLAQPPDCLLTGDSDFAMSAFVLKSFGEYSSYQVPGNLGATVYCRTNRPPAGASAPSAGG